MTSIFGEYFSKESPFYFQSTVKQYTTFENTTNNSSDILCCYKTLYIEKYLYRKMFYFTHEADWTLFQT